MSMSVTRSVVLLMCAIVHVFLATMKTLGPILWDGPEKKQKRTGNIGQSLAIVSSSSEGNT